MNLKDLKYLVALADYRHFSKASEMCFVSQPALSMQIKKLEEHLGVQLLERNPQAIKLTEVGEVIVAHARQILKEVREIQAEAKAFHDPYRGEIQIGVIPTISSYYLADKIPILSAAFPRLSIYWREEKLAVLLNQLQIGEVDAIIVAVPVDDKRLRFYSLCEEELLLAVSSNHSLAHYKMIRPSDMRGQSLLLLEEGHCLRDQTLEFCRRTRVAIRKDFQATSLETLRYMVANGIGMSLFPKMACKNFEGLGYIPFQSPKPKRTIGILWRVTTTRNLLLTRILECLKCR